jgi:AraC-like DNA-binding protein
MHKAAELLKQPLTIEQVASSVGFSDPLYFSRQFKKMYKKSPSNYRDHI